MNWYGGYEPREPEPETRLIKAFETLEHGVAFRTAAVRGPERQVEYCLDLSSYITIIRQIGFEFTFLQDGIGADIRAVPAAIHAICKNAVADSPSAAAIGAEIGDESFLEKLSLFFFRAVCIEPVQDFLHSPNIPVGAALAHLVYGYLKLLELREDIFDYNPLVEKVEGATIELSVDIPAIKAALDQLLSKIILVDFNEFVAQMDAVFRSIDVTLGYFRRGLVVHKANEDFKKGWMDVFAGYIKLADEIFELFLVPVPVPDDGKPEPAKPIVDDDTPSADARRANV